MEDRLESLKARLKERIQEERDTERGQSNKRRRAAEEENFTDATFLELPAGNGGLTLAVQRAGLPTLAPAATDDQGSAEELDLAKLDVFKRLKKRVKQKQVRWLHVAVHVQSFRKERRKGMLGRTKLLRNAAKPAGVEPKGRLLREANLRASRAAQLAWLQRKAGGWFSMESAWRSYLWDYPPVARLRRLKGVFLWQGDQCRFCGEHRKPTGWLGNAHFLEQLNVSCPGPPQHVHVPLQEFTQGYLGRAEYPQRVCDELAKSYKLAVVWGRLAALIGQATQSLFRARPLWTILLCPSEVPLSKSEM